MQKKRRDWSRWLRAEHTHPTELQAQGTQPLLVDTWMGYRKSCGLPMHTEECQHMLMQTCSSDMSTSRLTHS